MPTDEEYLAEVPPEPTEEEMLEVLAGEQKYNLPLTAEFPVKHNDEITRVPLSKMLNHYRQRATLDEKFTKLRTDREEVEKLRGDVETFNSMREKYGNIQTWSESNPDDWNRLWELYQNKDQALLQQNAGEDGALVNEIAALKQELGDLKNFRSQYEKEREDTRIRETTDSVNNEMDEIAKDFKENFGIDLDEKDEEGISLRSRILQHGIDNNIDNVKAAALHLLQPKLVESAVSKGRTEATKAIRKDTKDGVIARSETPFGQGAEVRNIRGTSYDDLAEDGRAEYERLVNET